jgi:hypothetical protein
LAAKLYSYPDVGSYGLAHSLLAYARCVLWSRDHEVPMLAPTWLHIKHRIGPILRGERDNRQYHRLFHFPGYVTGIRRLALLATADRIAAESADLAAVARERPGKVVVFRNLLTMNEETHFREIIGRGRQVRPELLAITKPRHVPQPIAPPYVALHVRMGDFSAPPSLEKLRAGAKNARIPLEWYCSMLTGVRARLSHDVPAVVLSDGSDEALAPLLRLPAVTRSPRQSSVSDLLTMSEGSLLISSGSGFSMWGSYLGDQPRICFPGQRLVRVLEPASGVDREPECESAQELSPQFLAQIFRPAASP